MCGPPLGHPFSCYLWHHRTCSHRIFDPRRSLFPVYFRLRFEVNLDFGTYLEAELEARPACIAAVLVGAAVVGCGDRGVSRADQEGDPGGGEVERGGGPADEVSLGF